MEFIKIFTWILGAAMLAGTVGAIILQPAILLWLAGLIVVGMLIDGSFTKNRGEDKRPR